MDLVALAQTLADAGQPAYRARQVWRWTAQGAAGFSAMTDLPQQLRERLDSEVPFSTLTLEHEAHAADGTVKALFRTADGRPIEAVLMRYRDGRRSLCLSSQSGCPLTCTFCATGQMRFGRNLTASEILDQALHFRRRSVVDHAVFMGMGEPLMNLDAVLEACRRLPDLGISHRHTAVSTVGWIPGIERLAAEPMPVRLALSLHAPEDALRSELMPVNDRYPLADVLDACRRFYAAKRRKVFVEYVMLGGVNDGFAQAAGLAEVLDPRMFKVNLIPYNPTGSRYAGSSPKAIDAFRAELERRGVEATVRLTRGRDIDAACGQLAARAPNIRAGMNRRTLSLLVAGGRIGFGAFLVADPGRLVSTWIGREGNHAGPQALGRAVGARDLVLGAGAIAADDDTLVPWLIAALVADSSDLLATLAARRGIPLRSRILVSAAALSGVAGDVAALAAKRSV